MNLPNIESLIAQGEGLTIEFKEAIPRQASDLSTELVAFANTQGGYLLLGVTDTGEVAGVADPQRDEERVMGLCRNCEPPLSVKVTAMDMGQRTVLIIDVPQGADKPYRVRGRSYIRAGSTTQPASREEERRLFQSAGQVLYERTPLIEADFDDLSSEKIQHYFEQRAPTATLNGSRSGRDLLIQADLPFMVSQVDRFVPTVVTMLLFGKRPTYYLPQATVSAARFPGGDIDLTAIDRSNFRGTVDELIEQSVAFVARNMRTASIVRDTDFPRRTDIPEYPLRAVREGITNAVMHRDYSVVGQPVTIAMFDDRLEIVNPGGLVHGMTAADLGRGKHVARNPTLAEAMRQLGWAERFGTGIRLIQREMTALESPEPQFTLAPDQFTLTLYAKTLAIWQQAGRRRYQINVEKDA